MKRGWSIPVVVALWLIAEGVALTQTRVTKNPLEGDKEAIRNGGAMFRSRCGCRECRFRRAPMAAESTGLRRRNASLSRPIMVRHWPPSTHRRASRGR